MSHPIFDELPVRYHDRVHIDQRDVATISVADGAFTVPAITDADRRAMGLPSGRHRYRMRDAEHPWYPPST